MSAWKNSTCIPCIPCTVDGVDDRILRISQKDPAICAMSLDYIKNSMRTGTFDEMRQLTGLSDIEQAWTMMHAWGQPSPNDTNSYIQQPQQPQQPQQQPACKTPKILHASGIYRVVVSRSDEKE